METARTKGREAFAFASWFLRGKYAMMRHFLPDLEDASRDPGELRREYLETVMHANRVAGARVAVTVLLGLGVLATAAATISQLAFAQRVLAVAAAWSASATLALLVARLLFDRYLDLVETCATFLGMQLAASARAPRPH